MKYCDLTQFYSPVSGGVKRYIQEKVEFIRNHRPEDSHVLVVPGERDECIESRQARIYTIASPLLNRTSRYRALLNLSAVEEVLELEKPDLIESGDPYQMAWKAIASGRALRIPVVAFYHSHFPEAYLRSTMKYFGQFATSMAMDFSRRYVRHLYNQFARTLVPSAALAALLRDWQVENVATVDLGVNTDIFSPEPDDRAATRKALGVSQDSTMLLYVGRLAAEKNTSTLFQAFELLEAEAPGRFHLVVVGDGTQRDRMQALVRSSPAVTWRGYCADSAGLAAYYRAADLFVHPGVLETFGLVTLESQACGSVVVGIRGSYMDRIIFTDQTDWAQANTPQALAAAILAHEQKDLRAAGLVAAQRVRERYGWEQVFTRLFEIYREAM